MRQKRFKMHFDALVLSYLSFLSMCSIRSSGKSHASPMNSSPLSLIYIRRHDGLLCSIEVHTRKLRTYVKIQAAYVRKVEVRHAHSSTRCPGSLSLQPLPLLRSYPLISDMLTRIASRANASASRRVMSSFKLPDLPYDYAALEPVISGEIMQIHHT